MLLGVEQVEFERMGLGRVSRVGGGMVERWMDGGGVIIVFQVVY